MLKKLRENYEKKSIQRVILSTFSCVTILSFLILAVIFTIYSKNILEKFAREKNEQQIEVLAEGMEREFRQTIDFLDTVHYKIIKKEFEDQDNFQKVMDFICEENNKYINQLVVFDQSGQALYENHQEEQLLLTEEQKQNMYANGRKDVGKTYFTLMPQQKDLLVYRMVEMEHEEVIKSAVLAVTLRYDKIVSGFQAHDAKEGNYFYIKTQEGDLFYHPKALQMKHGIYKEKLGMKSVAEDGASIEIMDHERFLVHQYTVGYTGWKIIGVSSLNDILYKDYPAGFLIWSLFFLVGLVVFGINHYIVKRITGPLSNLSKKVEMFGDKKIDEPITVEGTYEIKNLSDNFNKMQARIRHLMEKEVQKEQEYWSMKMRLLQSQINPHFLYNTLDSIIWMIQSKRYEGASKMVSALAGFFRISLNKGGDFITVGKEIMHVQNYMEIQGIRFEDKFSFQIECQESIKEYQCPKLIIQPLAENAVYHGMEGMYGDGEIEIKAYERDHLIYIDVTDNGEGMSEEQIHKILEGDVISSKRGSGIGVKNVNERLKYCFGEQYGVSVISEIDEGTTVRICIPKVEDLNEYWKKEKNFSCGIHDHDSDPGNFYVGKESDKEGSN